MPVREQCWSLVLSKVVSLLLADWLLGLVRDLQRGLQLSGLTQPSLELGLDLTVKVNDPAVEVMLPLPLFQCPDKSSLVSWCEPGGPSEITPLSNGLLQELGLP